MATLPTSSATGFSTSPSAPSSVNVTNTLFEDILNLSSSSIDSGSVFKLIWGKNTIIGILNRAPTFNFSTQYESTALAQLIGEGLSIFTAKVEGPLGTAVRHLIGSSQAQTQLVWAPIPTNYLTFSLDFTLLATYNSTVQVMDPTIILAQLVIPDNYGSGSGLAFTGIGGVSDSTQLGLNLEIGRWWSSHSLPEGLIVTNFNTAYSKSVMIDKYPAFSDIAMSLSSQVVPTFTQYKGCFL